MAISANKRLKAEDVVIARVVKARGIRGEVACDIETNFPERFDSLQQIVVVMPDGRRLDLRLDNSWFHKERVIIKFGGIDTMTDAERLVGGLLVITEADKMPLDEDEFYEYDVMGSAIVTERGEILGRVKSLMRTGANDLLVVVAEDGKEHLIPFVDDICTEVDIESRRITINPPEGLLDL